MVELPACPGFFLRHPAEWPEVSFAVGAQHPIELVDLALADHEAGCLPLSTMPGALHDLVIARKVHVRRATRHEEERAHRAAMAAAAAGGHRAVHR